MKNIFGFIIIFVLFVSCENIEVPFVIDSEEIERYLADDVLGQTFFSTQNLISDLPYNYPFDTTGYYVDILDSINREVISYFPLKELGAGFADPIQEFGPPFGSSEDAEVEVRDIIFGHTIRIEGVDTTLIQALFRIEYKRFGYFMKLGDDGQKFSGWLLRGFNGSAPERGTRMSLYHANNQWFSGDTLAYTHYTSIIYRDNSVPKLDIETRNGYLLLNADQTTNTFIEQVTKGEQLRAEVTATNLGVFYTMSFTTATDTILENFILNSNSKFEVSIQTPSLNSNTWDFIYFQEFVRDINDTTAVPRFQTLKRRNWAIPFKVQ